MRLIIACTAWLLACAPAGAQSACPVLPATAPPPEAVNWQGWRDRVAELDGQMATADLAHVRLLFLGDSLTEGWAPILFEHFYGPRAPLNLGVRGDTTRGLLWRLDRLPLGTMLRPQLVVLLIGTNDLWANTVPGDVAAGIGEVVHRIRQRLPQAHVVLLGLLPRGESPDDPMRGFRSAINVILARCADRAVTFVDPGGLLLEGDGRLTKDFAYDALHLSWLGYAILATALEPHIREALGG